jgi:hypothetical protein
LKSGSICSLHKPSPATIPSGSAILSTAPSLNRRTGPKMRYTSWDRRTNLGRRLPGETAGAGNQHRIKRPMRGVQRFR